MTKVTIAIVLLLTSYIKFKKNKAFADKFISNYGEYNYKMIVMIIKITLGVSLFLFATDLYEYFFHK